MTINFTDLSTGSPTSWQWNFGNGNTSTLQNPSAVFATPGTYNITLTVSNGGAPNTRIKSAFIKVHDSPAVNFTFDTASGCAPLSVKFNDQTSTSSGNISNWFWAFGDGGTSQAANPTYIYKQPGPKTISLKARNEHGCELTKTIENGVVVLGPHASFSSGAAAICTVPATFTFTNTSTGTGVLTYQWNFGDGQTSTAQSPSHIYNSAGNFEVVLKTKDASGCESTSSTKVYAGTDGGIDFQPSATKVCPSETIDFTTSTTDPVVSYLWDFGNGTTSTQAAPQVAYTTPGIYTVKLNAQLLGHTCNSLVTKVVEMAAPAVPSFTSEADCQNNLKLKSTSTNVLRVEWYINGTLASTAKEFTSPVHSAGGQTVKLIAFNAADCPYELERIENLPAKPVPLFKPNALFTCENPSLAGCAPFSVSFQNETAVNGPVTFLWQFGDGATSTAVSPTHVYTAKGLFQVNLVATDSRGCSAIETAFVKVSDTPPAGTFAIDKTVACAGEEVTFTAQTTNAEFWCWDFGDGGTDSGGTVTYKFPKPGTYTVKLTASNGCKTSIIRTNVITIKDPYVTYSFGKTCNDPYNVTLQNHSQNYDAIHWDFGDGQTSTDMNIGSHRYNAEGNYTLRLIGTNNTTGCTTIAFSNLVIQEVDADFEVSTDRPCKGSPIYFTDKSNAAAKWTWKIAGTTGGEQDFSTTIDTPGDYTAFLEIEDSEGCIATKTMPIKVIDMKGDFAFQASSTCEEFTVAFVDESTGSPPPNTWLWNFGDGNSSTDRHPTHIYSVPGKYGVALNISNTEGTCTFLKKDAVTFTVPEPDFVIAKEAYCPGETIVVANTSKFAATYEWDYGNGSRSDFDSPAIIYDTPGAYDISLFARDIWGCERKIIKDNFINVVKPKADFSVDASSGSCPPFAATFQDKSVADIEEWHWTFGDGKSSELQNPVNVFLKPGDFDVTLAVTDKYGCSDTKEAKQFVHVGGPSGSFTRTAPGLCTHKEISFQATTINAVTHTWDFGDGVVKIQSPSDISHTYTSTGTFKPNLLLTDANGCKIIADGSSNITISDTTAIKISVGPKCVFEGQSVRIIGDTESTDQLTWRWEIDNSIPAGNKFDVTTTINEAGLHYITGYATNQFNCVSSLSVPIHVQGPIDFVPNVITPNADGRNDTFEMDGLNNSEWDISILNRWGTLVHKEENYKGTWDAFNQPAGVYYFQLKNRLCDGLDYKGYISVLR